MSLSKTSPNKYFAIAGRPLWAPPAPVFAIVWSVLYTLIAVVVVRTWNRPRVNKVTLIINLACNIAWPFVFLKSPKAALPLTAVLLATAAMLEADLVADAQGTDGAGPLNASLWAPYVAWLSFAAILNVQAAAGWVQKSSP